MDGSPTGDRARAANAYIVWPLALLDLFGRSQDATAWSRLHTRQAFVFGIVGTLGYLVLLAFPLLVVIAVPAIGLGTVVWVYALGLAADLAVALFLFGLALSYRDRASRGELFSIPLVSALVDRLFRLER
ncbi:MAG TPA: hypothetical protein VE591_04075 [Candidatus Acidoferrum sp.]|nr:hypothetical protein [Candidatus Acidoferrum sp.]